MADTSKKLGNFEPAWQFMGVNVYVVSSTPNGVVSAQKGSLALNTAGSGTSDRAYINTDGSTTWTSITTAA